MSESAQLNTSDESAAARLIIVCSYPALNWSAALYPPVVSINGYEKRLTWNANEVAVAPGKHRVEVATASVYGKVARQVVDIDLRPGECVQLEYSAPHVFNFAGSLRVTLLAESSDPSNSPLTQRLHHDTTGEDSQTRKSVGMFLGIGSLVFLLITAVVIACLALIMALTG